jgi:hypothetical protein
LPRYHAGMQFFIDYDTKYVVRRLKGSADAVEKGGVRGLNRIAFKLRDETPKTLEKLIDRPTPFTLRKNAIVVHKASSTREGAIMRMNRLQSSYLGTLEYGGEKRSGNRGAMAAGNRSTDQFGNVRKRWHRRGALQQYVEGQRISVRGAKGVRQVGRFFIGSLRNSRRGEQVGVWERGRNNLTVRLVADFYRRQSYRAGQLGLHKEWDQQYREIADAIMEEAINYEIRKERGGM